MDREMLIDAWIAYHDGNCKNKDLMWAWDKVFEIVRDDPDSGWQVVTELVVAAPNDKILANVAAGPLEDLITLHHARIICRVDECARQSEKFRRCLTGVWCKGDIPECSYQIIEKYTATVSDPL